MSILGALFTGGAGLNANSNALGIISDNIANANTVGYKNTNAQFSTLVTQATSVTQYNPGGVQSQAVAQVSQQGILQSTAFATDLALSGGGFFVVNSATDRSGTSAFTRAGSFAVDANGDLKNLAGQFLQGLKLTPDDLAKIDAGEINSINFPAIGNLETVNVTGLNGQATPTTAVTLAANLPSTDTSTSDAREITMQLFDSQGNSHNLTLTLTRSATAANTWNVALPTTLSDGVGQPSFPTATNNVIAFNNDGTIDLTTSTFDTADAISISYGSGGPATQTLTFKLDGMTQFGDKFAVSRLDQNGREAGTFSSVSIDNNGLVTANFDNGQHQPIFLLPVATFSNANGLTPQTGNTYLASNESGTVLLQQAGNGTAGKILPSTLEGSTVDIATEFSNLIITQRAYSANAKIITTADQMLQELIDSKR